MEGVFQRCQPTCPPSACKVWPPWEFRVELPGIGGDRRQSPIKIMSGGLANGQDAAEARAEVLRSTAKASSRAATSRSIGSPRNRSHQARRTGPSDTETIAAIRRRREEQRDQAIKQVLIDHSRRSRPAPIRWRSPAVFLRRARPDAGDRATHPGALPTKIPTARR